MQSMVAQLKQGLCIDSKHVYATGFSFGGMMSNAIGCQMGDTFRAKNGCSSATRGIGTNGCVEYQGCGTNYLANRPDRNQAPIT
jgi:poly(3-hydroxybutyrate) depolymerase